MSLVAGQSITLKLEGVATSKEVDIKCLSGAGCPFVRNSPLPRVKVQRLLWGEFLDLA